MPKTQKEIVRLKAKIADFEGLRDILGDKTVNEKITKLQALIQTSSGDVTNSTIVSGDGNLVEDN